ncbi:MAG TPA: segregation/condensation protein A [Thermoanaerobaculia bacterium]|jgi:segregation and condensation protein A|nr:segregation/condensation protein A [Thermoanaerobaculia bacterium]
MSDVRPSDGTLPESWRVCLPVFEGPLDLLLHLVKVNQVEIADIPVARICDQFHEYLALMEELDLDVAGEYVYEAALLIQLKSRMLLPRPVDSQGEPIADPRQELVRRLLEYRRLKEAAQSLAEVHSVRSGIWVRHGKELQELAKSEGDEEAAAGQAGEGLDLGEVSLYDLLKVMHGVLDRYQREHPPELQLHGEVFSVRDQLQRLWKRLEGGRPFDALDDLRSRSCRAEAVSAFLAVLEMARLGLVRLHQTKTGAVLLYRTAKELDADALEGIHG